MKTSGRVADGGLIEAAFPLEQTSLDSVHGKNVRRFGHAPSAAAQDAADLVRLPLQTVSTAMLAEDALSRTRSRGAMRPISPSGRASRCA